MYIIAFDLVKHRHINTVFVCLFSPSVPLKLVNNLHPYYRNYIGILTSYLFINNFLVHGTFGRFVTVVHFKYLLHEITVIKE